MASIKKLSERKYKITVSNGYRANGQKICKAKTITVPNSVRIKSIPQYVAHEAEEYERYIKLGYSEDSEMTFEQYAERWLERQKSYAPSTLGSYRRMLKVVYPFIGSIKLKSLRPIALENMLLQIRKRTAHGKPIQESTAQKYLTVVSAVLSDAKRNEIITKNAAHMIDLPDTEKKEQDIPSLEEAREMIYMLQSEPWHYLVYYILAIYTGCRRGELCALKWSDFSFEDDISTLTVSRSRSSVLGSGIEEGTTKNGHSRMIILDDDITTILKRYRQKKENDAKAHGAAMSPYLFTNDQGQLIHPDTFTKHLRRIYDKNGFPKEYHLHTLRHYFVSSLLHSGIDKQTVADLAGHCDTSFLERTYCHPQLDLKKDAAKAISSQELSKSYVSEKAERQHSGLLLP